MLDGDFLVVETGWCRDAIPTPVENLLPDAFGDLDYIFREFVVAGPVVVQKFAVNTDLGVAEVSGCRSELCWVVLIPVEILCYCFVLAHF